MSIEHDPQNGRLMNGFHELGRSTKEVVYREVAKAGAELIDFRDPNGYIDEFYFLRQNRFPIVYANHESHIDEGVFIEAVDRLNKIGNTKINFNLPLAVSLRTADQSSLLTNFYNSLVPLLESHRIHPIEVAREVDKIQYKIQGTVREYFELMRSPQRGLGVVAFPQARVMSGRMDAVTGERIGMIKVINDMLPQLVKKSLERAKKEVAFLPIGINGTYRIYDPGIFNSVKDEMLHGTAKITSETWKALAMQKIGLQPKLATAVVGKPFTSNELFEDGISLNDSDAVNTYLMKKVATLIPTEARGVYV